MRSKMHYFRALSSSLCSTRIVAGSRRRYDANGHNTNVKSVPLVLWRIRALVHSKNVQDEVLRNVQNGVRPSFFSFI